MAALVHGAWACYEAQRLASAGTSLVGHVFVAMSEQEPQTRISAMHEFVEKLETAGGSDLHLVSEVYPTERHSAAGIALTYLHGLRSVFAGMGTLDEQ